MDSPQLRTCVCCGLTDDHPRHTGSDKGSWHIDCHAVHGGCESCKAQIADANDAKGDGLRDHLISLRQEG